MCRINQYIQNQSRLHSFKNINLLEAFMSILELAIPSFIACLILGLLTLIPISSSQSIFLHAINEFIQPTTIKLLLLSCLALTGACIMSFKYRTLSAIFSWISASAAKLGFTLSSALIGVCSALSIPSWLQHLNINDFYKFISLSFLFVFFCTSFFFVAKMTDTENITTQRIILGRQIDISIFIHLMGFMLILSALYFFHIEEWKEVFKPQ